MSLFIFDCEVFAHDWLFVFKNGTDGEYSIFHNDYDGVKAFLEEGPMLCGFNNKHYDQFILKAVLAGLTPEEVKAYNDYIIAGGNGWQYPPLQDFRCFFSQLDLMDDMQKGLSLKAIEGHLGMNIRESTVDFTIDHPLTEDELAETVRYCKHDVDATEALYKLRKNYVKAKVQLGQMVGISPEKAAYMTNAKLTAAYLGARPPVTPWTDEREYTYPPNLRREYIPPEVFDFFDRMHDKSIPDDDLFSSKLDIVVGGCPCKLGFGGIHGALRIYQEETAGTRVIRNYDVASLYPSLMIKCGYTSRNIPDPKRFEETYNTRLAAKHSGDKVTANTLKLVLNTTYGAMLNQYNDLYDPLMGRSVCISGQLFLLELACHYVADLKTVTLIQLNTDGIMVSIEEDELPALLAINDEWQQRTGFLLEEDRIRRIVQKDVNGYVEIAEDGSTKVKGGYLTHGIAPAGAFNVNNSAIVVKKAIIAYFVDGTPVEDTVNAATDPLEFQIIAKAGAKYREAYHLVDGIPCPVQRVNRVYATTDERYGKLFKVKAEDDSTAKIESLPENCIIDNECQITIDQIDKGFYIKMARTRVNEFLGIKEKKERKPRMTATKPAVKAPMNVYEKLLEARFRVLQSGMKKSGKNMHLSFKYFELEDIVPVATPIFKELGLLALTTFTSDTATMTVINVENPEEKLIFTSPMRSIEAFNRETGNKAVNPTQALGSEQTFQRRYLYMAALDIVESDAMDAGMGQTENPDGTPAPAAPAKKPAPPATPTQREEVKETLTAPDGQADALQIRRLKDALKKLREATGSDDYVSRVAVATQGFTVMTKRECEKWLVEISELLVKAQGGKK